MCTGPQKRMVSVKRAISNKNIRTMNIKRQKETACCYIAIEHGIVVFEKYLLEQSLLHNHSSFGFRNNKTFQL